MKTTHLAPDKDPSHSKTCTLCSIPRDVLIRCQIDETGTWHFVCPGSCWSRVSGGKVDGDAEHPLYRYGGMWKNKHEAVSAKKPKSKPKPQTVNAGAEAGDADVMDDVPDLGDEHDRADQDESDDHETDSSSWSGDGVQYTANDRINFEGRTWICRKTHKSEASRPPNKAQNLWKGKARLVDS